jgi:hypothetical protein
MMTQENPVRLAFVFMSYTCGVHSSLTVDLIRGSPMGIMGVTVRVSLSHLSDFYIFLPVVYVKFYTVIPATVL